MRVVAAYLLAVLGGNNSPSGKDIKKILDSVGVQAEDDRIDKLLSELEGKDVNEVIANGLSKLSSVPSGGVAAAGASGAAAGGGAAAEAQEEEKKAEEEEEEESEDEDMGFSLFD